MRLNGKHLEMERRDFIKYAAFAGTSLMLVGGLNSCIGTYKPDIINAVWNEKFVFDSPDKAMKIRQMIRCAIMAPSGNNTQPWLFKISNDAIKIMPDMSRRLPVADRDDRELFISLGAALENILIAAPQFGFNAEYEVIDSESDKILIHITQHCK